MRLVVLCSSDDLPMFPANMFRDCIHSPIVPDLALLSRIERHFSDDVTAFGWRRCPRAAQAFLAMRRNRPVSPVG